jgi:LacI family transcriptional regulator
MSSIGQPQRSHRNPGGETSGYHPRVARQRVTLKEVAERAGVHIGTVSKALKESTRGELNQQTIERVLKAAAELQYTPNATARNLQSSRTSTIGVLFPDVMNPFFPPILRSIDDVLFEAGYITLVSNTDHVREREEAAIATFRSRQVDGIIIATAASDQALLGEIERSGIQFVTINRTLPWTGSSSVRSDDEAGIAALVDYLVDLGHHDIAEIRGPDQFETGIRRHDAFKQALSTRELPAARPGWSIRAGAYTIDDGRRCVGDILDMGVPTAIVAGNDLLAIGAIEGLKERGLDCPRDVSVAGFNDMILADRLSPPLTTVHVDKKELGTAAARLMLQLLSVPDSEPEHVVLPVSLVIRGSSGPPRTGS